MQLSPHIEEFRNVGAELSIVGSGLPQHIEGFRETTGYSAPIYTDPSLKVFAKAGLIRSALGTFGPTSVLKGIRSMKKGLRQGKTQGDAFQQGGALVIGQGGELLYQHQSRAGGDNALPKALLSALEPPKTARPDLP